MQEKRRKISERLFDIYLKIFYNKNMKKAEMNEKLKAVYDFTVQYLDNYGYPPSVRGIEYKIYRNGVFIYRKA